MKPANILVLSITFLLIISACGTNEEKPKEKVVEFGRLITFDYAAGFDNGTLFDTSFDNVAKEAGIFNPDRVYEPLTMEYGQSSFIPGLEDALLGMKEGEVRNIRISPKNAYGEKIENSTRVFLKTTFENYENLIINDIATIVTPKGTRIKTYVKEIGEENITVDLNHPLAGQNISFSIIMRNIE